MLYGKWPSIKKLPDFPKISEAETYLLTGSIHGVTWSILTINDCRHLRLRIIAWVIHMAAKFFGHKP